MNNEMNKQTNIYKDKDMQAREKISKELYSLFYPKLSKIDCEPVADYILEKLEQEREAGYADGHNDLRQGR